MWATIPLAPLDIDMEVGVENCVEKQAYFFNTYELSEKL